MIQSSLLSHFASENKSKKAKDIDFFYHPSSKDEYQRIIHSLFNIEEKPNLAGITADYEIK